MYIFVSKDIFYKFKKLQEIVKILLAIRMSYALCFYLYGLLKSTVDPQYIFKLTFIKLYVLVVVAYLID